MVTAVAFAGKAVATPAISFLIGKAFSYLDKYRKSEGMEELKNRLELAMPKIQAVFNVVNPDHVGEQSPALDAWLWQLRDAVEDAENVVDELEYYELAEKAEKRKVSDWGSPLAKMKYKAARSVKNIGMVDKALKNFAHGDTLQRLKKAVEGLDRTAADVPSLLAIAGHLKGSGSTSQQPVNNDRETSSDLSASKFVGREKEKEKIIGWITNTLVESPETVTRTSSVSIISVIGHGGMGKTTLAQSISTEVQSHFKVIWVTVSTSFDATSVTSKILESVTGNKPSSDHLEPLQKLLKEKLNSMKFLLVLDDVWEDKKEVEWDKLFAPLRNVSTGSKILLTTRMQSVADMATSSMGVDGGQCVTLQGLENNENIELFNHHVSSGLNAQDFEHFKPIGEQIARKLGGCPLVTKVIAGHLRGNMMIEFWNRFLLERLKHFNGTEEEIMRVLRLSYYSLPTELQICFRYCCIFPQDHKFRKKGLIQMWMGSGLIPQHASGSQDFEDIGEQILVQLKKKSFFDLISIVGSYGTRKEEYYIMHDLMHDLARNVSAGECARITHPAMFKNHNCTVRHMCIANIGSFSVDEVSKISNFENLRTIIIDYSSHAVKKDVVCALERVVESLKFLHLFYARLVGEDGRTLGLAAKWGKLKHLRYLRLGNISPEVICGVARLYHLMLLCCNSFGQNNKKQQRYLGNIDRLRYVHSDVVFAFPVARLTHLKELHYLVQESRCNKLSAVKNLRTLHTLQVSGLENVKNPEEAKDVKLNEIISLYSLSLSWSLSAQPNNTDELVLDHLEPHCGVTELKISGYSGIKLPFWIEDLSVKNLVSLELCSCLSWERLPSLRKLVWLRHIELVGLFKLQQIGDLSSSTSTEFFLPPRLETLYVHHCPLLRELPVLPPSLVSLRIDRVGLTKLPMIDSESSETKPSQLMVIDVEYCDSLTSLEGSLFEQKMYMGALQYLQIAHCDSLESESIEFEGMNRLTTLAVMGCPKFSTMGTVKRELSNLGLVDCPSLVSLPSADVFMNFKSLQHMHLSGCKNLSSLGGLGSLPYLNYLSISGCSKLVEVGSSLAPPHASSSGEEEHLVQINRLEIDLPSLLLVEPLKRLRRTTMLQITDGSQMESLPERWLLQNRQFLQWLRIYSANSLKSLPLSMRELSSLEQLRISECQLELLNELRENSNSELNKVSHIRRVGIVSVASDASNFGTEGWFIMGKECDRETYDRLSYADIDAFTSWVNQPNEDKGVESSVPSSQPWWRKYQCCLKNSS